MHRTPAIRSGISMLLIGLVAAACTAGSATGSDSPVASATPAATATGPTTASETPTPTVGPATPDPSAVTDTPPVATLAVDGGDPVAGQLGSYTWNGGGSDSPWLPGTAITIGAGERITASLDPAVAVSAWSVRRAPSGSTDGTGAVGLGDGAGPIAFDPPATGHWSLQLTVGFADELGSAVYYWDVTVR
jgi:hypothetical protein